MCHVPGQMEQTPSPRQLMADLLEGEMSSGELHTYLGPSDPIQSYVYVAKKGRKTFPLSGREVLST